MTILSCEVRFFKYTQFQYLDLLGVEITCKTAEPNYPLVGQEIHTELESSFHMILVSVLLRLFVLWLQYYVKLVESFISFAMHLA